MKKRKQKHGQQQSQKISIAQHKNEFFRKLENMCKTLNVHHIFKLIPRKLLDHLYERRVQTVRVVASPDCDIPASVMNNFKIIISEILKWQMVPVNKEKSININLNDYLSTFSSVILILLAFEKDDYDIRIVNTIKEALKDYNDFFLKDHTAINAIAAIIKMVSTYESDISHKMYWTSFELLTFYKNRSGNFRFLTVHSIVPEKKYFTINGYSRQAMRVGWSETYPEYHFGYVNLTAEQLNLKTSFNKLQLAVYIQSHALQRLSERLDGIPEGSLHFHLYVSLKHFTQVNRDKNGNLLFSMIVFDQKVGYLLADIIESDLVIRTFLFLTNSGTPEGDRLLELTGLAIEDTKYLEINKLSTFLESDIESNERVKNIFIKAGCESLFKLDRDILEKESEFFRKPKAEFILDYLGMNSKDEDIMEHEEESEG